MPTLADIIIKKADGTTSLTYNALASGAADSIPAIWRAESIGAVPGNRPQLSIAVKSSKDRKARLVDVAFSYPETVTDTTTGIVSVRLRPWFKGTVCQSVDATDTTSKELAFQLGNLLSSDLVRSIMQSGNNAR